MFDHFIFPDADKHCRKACLSQVHTLDAAIDLCKVHDRQHIAVQAGGNCGVFPQYMASQFNRVYTFEPETANFLCLRDNIEADNVFMYHAALGQIRGCVTLQGSDDNAGAWVAKPDDDGHIPVLRIDDLGLPGCDLIQLDVEGYELEALKGAVLTIDRYKPVIMFEDRGYREPMGYIEKWLETFGYKVIGRTARDVICSAWQ